MRRAVRFSICLLLALLGVAVAGTAPAVAQQSDVQTAWQLLDYMSVDYSGAVANGKVVSQSEYAEMREFAGSVRQRIGGLPANSAKAELLSKADRFVAAVERKEFPREDPGHRRRLG